MLSDIITVSIPKKPDYISTVRLISSSLGNKIGYNIDQIEDLKVNIKWFEALNLLIG